MPFRSKSSRSITPGGGGGRCVADVVGAAADVGVGAAGVGVGVGVGVCVGGYHNPTVSHQLYGNSVSVFEVVLQALAG